MVEKTNYSFRARAELAGYQAAAALVSLLGAASLPFLPRFSRRIRQGFFDYLGLLAKPENRPVLWVHGVSMGESMVAMAFAGELKKLFPGCSLVFTSTHPDVIDNVKKKGIADVVAYFPLDNYLFMRRAFERVRPAAVFVAETDFWPVFSHCCRSLNLPLLLINGRISGKIERFYQQARGLAEVVFQAFSLFLVQSEIDRQRLETLGVKPDLVRVVGNIKADLTATAVGKDLKVIKDWKGQRKLLVFGSLHPSEFDFFKPMFKKMVAAGHRCLIAPRNPKFADEWWQQCQSLGLKTTLRSQALLPEVEVLLLDTMGELASIYALGEIAIVGGSIDRFVGGHNPLEVIQSNVPLMLGPNCRNFADIVDELQQSEAVFVGSDIEEFIVRAETLLSQKRLAAEMAARASVVLQNNRGALARSLQEIKRLLNF